MFTINDFARLFDAVDDITRALIAQEAIPERAAEIAYSETPSVEVVAPKNRRQILRTFKHVMVRWAWEYHDYASKFSGHRFSRLGYRMCKYAQHFKHKFRTLVYLQYGRKFDATWDYASKEGDIGVFCSPTRGYQLYNIVYLTPDGELGFGHPEARAVEIAYVAYNNRLPTKPPAAGFSAYKASNDNIGKFISGSLSFVNKKKLHPRQVEQARKKRQDTSRRIYAFDLDSVYFLSTKYGMGRITNKSLISRELLKHTDIILTGQDCTTTYTWGAAIVKSGTVTAEIRPTPTKIFNSFSDVIRYVSNLIEKNEAQHVLEIRLPTSEYTVKLNGRKVNGLKVQVALAEYAARLIFSGPDFMKTLRSYVKLPPQYRKLAVSGLRVGPYVVPIKIEKEKMYVDLGDRSVEVSRRSLMGVAYGHRSRKSLDEFAEELGMSMVELMDKALALKWHKNSPEEKARKTLRQILNKPWVREDRTNYIVTSVTGREWHINKDTGEVRYNGRWVCIVDLNNDLPFADRLLTRIIALRNDRMIASDVYTVRRRLDNDNT